MNLNFFDQLPGLSASNPYIQLGQAQYNSLYEVMLEQQMRLQPLFSPRFSPRLPGEVICRISPEIKTSDKQLLLLCEEI